jgi:outer membrane protein assembly factor BamB
VLAILLFVTTILAALGKAPAADWPQWRFDAARSAASPEDLGSNLHLAWVRRLPPPKPAWPKYPRMCFDTSYEPVVMGGTLFLNSMVTDSVTALDTTTGAEKWRFYTDGPVRFAPVAFDGKLAFVSDDGYLYCVDADRGTLLWKVHGLKPDGADRKVLGNGRLISLFPARGGPVWADGKIYFAAGVWPFEGVCVRAVDAQTGEPVWSNEKIEDIELGLTDHSTRQDSGLSPQGYLALIGQELYVPSGRALPGRLNAASGELEPYVTGWGGRDNLEKGSWYVSGSDAYLFHSGEPYDRASNTRLEIDPANSKELGEFRDPIIAENAVYYSRPVNQQEGYRPAGTGYDAIVALDVTNPPELKEWEDEGKRKWKTGSFPETWTLPAKLKVQIKAGPRLYGGAEGTVAAVDLPGEVAKPKISWEASIEGTPSRMLAADGKLFVVTREGSLYAFGPEEREPKEYAAADPQRDRDARPVAPAEANLLEKTANAEGYCLVFGAPDAELMRSMALGSKLHFIVVDPDAELVASLRRRFTDNGLYGTRIVVHQGDPASYPFPPYMASLILAEENAESPAAAQARARRLFGLLRPYGGVACLAMPPERQNQFVAAVEAAKLSGAITERVERYVLLKRPQGPAGAADWSHENADAAGSLVSSDVRVKAPLEILWFGGPIDELFPLWDFTHSNPPTALVSGGRMFFQVFPQLHAVDVYTGRPLWTVTLPGTEADPKRRKISYAAAADGLYVSAGDACHRLDPATGKLVAEFRSSDPGAIAWREIRVFGDSLLCVTANGVLCFDRNSGAARWQYSLSGTQGTCVVGDGRVFCAEIAKVDRSEKVIKAQGRLVALDAAGGKELWQADVQFQGESRVPLRLAYSRTADVLVAVFGTTNAYQGAQGSLLWGNKAVAGAQEPILHQSQLITQAGNVYDLLTGSRLEEGLFNGKRRGCTRVIAAENLLAIRDGQASYLDLSSGRQDFFRGIRTGCTNGLIPAAGMICAPDFAHGCACNYPVFTSMGLVHLPEAGQ